MQWLLKDGVTIRLSTVDLFKCTLTKSTDARHDKSYKLYYYYYTLFLPHEAMCVCGQAAGEGCISMENCMHVSSQASIVSCLYVTHISISSLIHVEIT